MTKETEKQHVDYIPPFGQALLFAVVGLSDLPGFLTLISLLLFWPLCFKAVGWYTRMIDKQES